jgi:hypothetical protein
MHDIVESGNYEPRVIITPAMDVPSDAGRFSNARRALHARRSSPDCAAP